MNNNLTCSTTESILPPVEISAAAYNIGQDAVFSCKFTHRLRFTANVFAAGNTTLSEILCRESRHCSSTAIFIDANVARTRANLVNKIIDYFKKFLPENSPKIHIIPGGEQIKNQQRNFRQILEAMEQSHLCRKSFVIAMGGGAVLDAVGFASSITHRGL
ncbi:MAG: hypothetical protein ACYSUX_18690, partial [Planctomycetota bacterium]